MCKGQVNGNYANTWHFLLLLNMCSSLVSKVAGIRYQQPYAPLLYQERRVLLAVVGLQHACPNS